MLYTQIKAAHDKQAPEIMAVTLFDPVIAAQRQKQSNLIKAQVDVHVQDFMEKSSQEGFSWLTTGREMALEIQLEVFSLLEENKVLGKVFQQINNNPQITDQDKAIIAERTSLGNDQSKIIKLISEKLIHLDLEGAADQRRFFELCFHFFTETHIGDESARLEIMSKVLEPIMERYKDFEKVLVQGFENYISDNCSETVDQNTLKILANIIETMVLPLRQITSEQHKPLLSARTVSLREKSAGHPEDVAPGYYSKAAAPIAIPFADEIQKIKDKYQVTIKRADEIELIAIGLDKKNVRTFYNTSMTHDFETRDFDLSRSETQAAQEIVQVVTQWAKHAEKEKLRVMKDLLATVRTAFYKQQ